MAVNSGRMRGFSVLELMITIAVLAILVGVALPSMRDLIARNKISSEVNRLVSDLLLARNTAITRGTFVTICRSNDSATCGGGLANRFDQGWLTYVSPATRTAFSGAAGNELLKVGELAPPEIQIKTVGTQAPDYITYLSTGRVDPATAGNIVITICVTNGGASGVSSTRIPGRRLTLSVSGRPALSEIAPGGC